jgi:hypothetical protein
MSRGAPGARHRARRVRRTGGDRPRRQPLVLGVRSAADLDRAQAFFASAGVPTSVDRPGPPPASARRCGSRTRSASPSSSSTPSTGPNADPAVRPAPGRAHRPAGPLQPRGARHPRRLPALLRAGLRLLGDDRGRTPDVRRLDVPQADRPRRRLHRRRRAAPAPPRLRHPREPPRADDLRHLRRDRSSSTTSSAVPAGTGCRTPSTSTSATPTGTGSRSTPATTTPATPTTRPIDGACTTSAGATTGATR